MTDSNNKPHTFSQAPENCVKIPIRLQVNGNSYLLEVEPRRTLLDALRFDLGLTGAKRGCNMGECGACTIVIDGKAVYSCLLLAIECEGKEILTIEGLGDEDDMDPIQEAFIKHDAYQCGFCTPGQVMSLKALLDNTEAPTEEDIKIAVSGNICRCGTYKRIVIAAEDAVEAYKNKKWGGGSHGKVD